MRPELFTIPGLNLTIPSFGAMSMIGFLGAVWWMTRRAAKVKADPDLVLNFGFIALIFSVLGARAFYVLHYWDTQFKHQPGQILNLSGGGFEFYGGLIGAMVPCLLYAMYKRLSLRLWLDLMTPSLLFGMGVGRIGCWLFGCCWGASCPADLPWAAHFPYGSPPQHFQWEQRQVALPARLILVDPEGGATLLTARTVEQIDAVREKGRKAAEEAKAKGETARLERIDRALARLDMVNAHMEAQGVTRAELAALGDDPEFSSAPLHPSQLYSAVGPLLLAWLTNAYFYRRKRHGTVFLLGMALYAVERFIEESLRTDNPQDVFGLTISQAVSVVVIVLVVVGYAVLRQMPLRSRRAVAYTPATEPDGKAAPAAG
ncbi:MAG: hypothetical protein AMXMBFR13_21860 [Phycisphaerae bacterium]